MNSKSSKGPETRNSGPNRLFFVPCDLRIWQMTLKSNRALLSPNQPLAFGYLFLAIGEFKLELLSGNDHFGSKSAIFFYLAIWRMTLKNNRAPLLCYQALCTISQPSIISNSSNSPGTPKLGHIRHFFVQCELEIWRMLSKNNRTPLLRYFNRCASFRSHL